MSALFARCVCFGSSIVLIAVSARAEVIYERYPFTTFVGNAGPGTADGVGDAARFYGPQGVAVDGDGNVYVADTKNGTIRKIASDRRVSTLAGGASVNGPADGTGAAAAFHSPTALAVDPAGVIYVTDTGFNTIRRISRDGVVTTLAGLRSGPPGYADGSTGEARFAGPEGIAIDGVGNLYVADTGNQVIRKITPDGQVSTIAGAHGESGNADGTASAARFRRPAGIALDASGNVYVADSDNNSIRKIDLAGYVSTLAGSGFMFAGSQNGTGNAARFYHPRGLAVDDVGNVFVADGGNSLIRRVAADGSVTTVAGLGYPDGSPGSRSGSDDGIGSAARFNYPSGLALNQAGELLVADTGNHAIRKITPAAEVSTFAGMAGGGGYVDSAGVYARFNDPAGMAADASGNLYVSDRKNGAVRKITPSGVVSTVAKGFNFPEAVAVDRVGNVYVAETSSNRIRKVSPDGTVTTLAGSFVLGHQDGPGAVATFLWPNGLVVDPGGNVYVADSGNDLIRKITPSGIVSTFVGRLFADGSRDGVGLAAEFDSPSGMALDAEGNIFVANTYTNTIRKITPGAVVTTIAGTPPGVGGYAAFVGPRAVALDRSGNILVVDSDRIQKVTSDGRVVTIGGQAPPYTSGSKDGIGSSARFLGPRGVIVGADGFIYVADSGNNTIRRGGPNAVSQLVNLSARAKLRAGDDVLIGGFILSGEGSVGLGLRAIGPSLGAAGISEALRDPMLEIRGSDGKLVAANDNWRENSFDGRSIRAYGIPPSNEAESAIVWDLKAQRSYTAVLRPVDGGGGVALVEIYQRENGAPVELVNMSARGFIGTSDDVLIAGFFMGGGEGTGRVLLRALGPSLSQAGVNSALTDPVLSLHDANGAVLAANNDWKDSEKEAIEATGIPPGNDHESALLAILRRGSYTAIVAGKDGTTGVGTVEVYKLPDELK